MHLSADLHRTHSPFQRVVHIRHLDRLQAERQLLVRRGAHCGVVVICVEAPLLEGPSVVGEEILIKVVRGSERVVGWGMRGTYRHRVANHHSLEVEVFRAGCSAAIGYGGVLLVDDGGDVGDIDLCRSCQDYRTVEFCYSSTDTSVRATGKDEFVTASARVNVTQEVCIRSHT